MSVAKTKEAHSEMMAEQFNEIMQNYSAGKIPASETVVCGVEMLKCYLESSHCMYKTPHFQIAELIRALEKTGLGKQRRTLDKRFLEGCLIEGLIRFGSIPEQTYKFMRDYTTINKSACITSRKLFATTYSTNNELAQQDDEAFVLECGHWIIEFCNKFNDKVKESKKYKTAYESYLKLYKSCKDSVSENENSDWPIYRLRPFEQYQEEVKSLEST